MLHKIRTVLIHNSHPGNIGSSARAMKNMGLEKLYLVAPKRFPAKEAFYMASRADDIVERAIVVETLEQALEGCTLVLGASSRSRALKWHEVSPKIAAEKMIQEITSATSGEVAVLYGCEQNGLTNEELELSHYQIVIPAIPDYASLNVAQAVQLISYEIYVAYLERIATPDSSIVKIDENTQSLSSCDEPATKSQLERRGENIFKETPLATVQDMERFYEHLEQTLIKIQVLDPKEPRLMMSRLRRLFAAARLDQTELQILRGILTAILKRV